MPCPVLTALSAAVAMVPSLPSPTGLGADAVLAGQVHGLGSAAAAVQFELAVRMAALEAQGAPAADVRGDAVRAGIGAAQAGLLRQLGLFAADRPDIEAAWRSGTITIDQVKAVRDGTVGLATPVLRDRLVGMVLPHLPALDARATRRLVAFTVDQLAPGDPDHAESSDHAARRLAWARGPGGGIVLEGYLPAPEADAFVRAIGALVEDLRTAGDRWTLPQRRADALAALLDRAGLPAGGGLPAAMTLTVSLTEAARIAQRDPAGHGTGHRARPRGGSLVGGQPAGDAAVRFGLCCAAITPVLHQSPDTGPQQGPGLPEAPAPGSLLHRIAGTRTEPLAVGRAKRLATPAQRHALQLRDGGCAIPGCAVAAAHTQPHHVTPWAIDGKTDLGNLVSLCFVHHRQTELGHYRFLPRNHPEPPTALEHPNWWIIPPHA